MYIIFFDVLSLMLRSYPAFFEELWPSSKGILDCMYYISWSRDSPIYLLTRGAPAKNRFSHRDFAWIQTFYWDFEASPSNLVRSFHQDYTLNIKPLLKQNQSRLLSEVRVSTIKKLLHTGLTLARSFFSTDYVGDDMTMNCCAIYTFLYFYFEAPSHVLLNVHCARCRLLFVLIVVSSWSRNLFF